MVLLISPQIIIKLFGIKGIEKKIFEIIKKNAPADKPLGISARTFENVLKGVHAPSSKTLQNIFNSSPDLNNKYFRALVKNPTQNVNPWKHVLNAMESIQNFDLFPCTRKKISDLVNIEDALEQKIVAAKSVKERLKLYANNQFVSQLLSPPEKSLLRNATIADEGVQKVFGRIQLKAVLYIAAYIDAEHAVTYQKLYGPNFSVLALLMPIFEPNTDKPLNPIERLFRRWSKATDKKYAYMAQAIHVDTNNKDKSDSQKRKFRQWRQGEKQAPYNEIEAIVKHISPGLNSLTLFNTVLLYYYATFLSNLFKESLHTPKHSTNFFDSDRELVEWMSEQYNRFFNKAYSELEVLTV